MGSFSHSHANAALTYSNRGVNLAKARVPKMSFTYAQNSEESHARQHRAYYPHRRSQGNFSLTFACNGWREFNQLVAWFRDYANIVLNLDAAAVPPPMTVAVPSRNFLRLGIPSTGLQYGDHIGSLVFNPTIDFLSVSDPGDSSTAILKINQVSGQSDESGKTAKPSYFYPTQIGKLEKYLYDQGAAQRVATAAELAAEISATISSDNKRRQQEDFLGI